MDQTRLNFLTNKNKIKPNKIHFFFHYKKNFNLNSVNFKKIDYLIFNFYCDDNKTNLISLKKTNKIKFKKNKNMKTFFLLKEIVNFNNKKIINLISF